MASKPRRPLPTWWLVHDIALGVAGGLALGFIVGLLIAAAVSGVGVLPDAVAAAGPVLGAVVSVRLLYRSHQKHGGFLTASVVVFWVLTMLGVALIVTLIYAIDNWPE